ncbi:MAG: hypothetical protein LC799_22590 [Actinobacteria bacterium]|nr:hypothetical protein [Actinomycetota bacterium]
MISGVPRQEKWRAGNVCKACSSRAGEQGRDEAALIWNAMVARVLVGGIAVPAVRRAASSAR